MLSRNSIINQSQSYHKTLSSQQVFTPFTCFRDMEFTPTRMTIITAVLAKTFIIVVSFVGVSIHNSFNYARTSPLSGSFIYSAIDCLLLSEMYFQHITSIYQST